MWGRPHFGAHQLLKLEQLTSKRCFGDIRCDDAFPNSVGSLLEDFRLEITGKLRVDRKDGQLGRIVQFAKALCCSHIDTEEEGEIVFELRKCRF